MRPVSFDYHRAESLEHAVHLLAELGEEARPLAGGYSLVPMMNLRLARPLHLVDINGLDLDEIAICDALVRLGGLVRHSQLLSDRRLSEALPLFREAAAYIAHPTIRNRGTLGGSLAHADPTAELSLMALLHDAVIVTCSQDGERRIGAGDFFKGAFTTALNSNEIVVALEIPASHPASAGAFVEFAERRGDFAIVAVGVLLQFDQGRISRARIACAGATSVPVRGLAAEAFLVSRSLDDPGGDEAGRILADAYETSTDIRASVDYRKHLIAELTARAVNAACGRARGMQ